MNHLLMVVVQQISGNEILVVELREDREPILKSKKVSSCTLGQYLSDSDRKVLAQFVSSIQCLPEWCTDCFDQVEMEFHLSTDAEAPQQLRHLYSRGANHIVQLNTLQ